MSNVVDRIEEYVKSPFKTENLKHLFTSYEPCKPGDRALCGAVLKGIDHGFAPYDRDTCCVCIDIAEGALR